MNMRYGMMFYVLSYQLIPSFYSFQKITLQSTEEIEVGDTDMPKTLKIFMYVLCIIYYK